MIRIPQITTDELASQFIEEQMRMRLDLIQNPQFVKECISFVQSQGMSAEVWNENMLGILMMFANEVVGYGYKNNLI
jgi:hypothetical protein